VRVYLDDVRAAYEATGQALVVDVGCGRGEWLEVLREAGIAARGVDSNEEMVKRGTALGLEIVRGDGVQYLRTLATASVGAVTGFHVIEHLQFPELVALFAEALRVLKPGGMILFETPNPENLAVGAHTFWYDPTHVRPLPAAMVEYLAQSQGFARAEVRRLHPHEAWELLGSGPDADVRARLNQALYGPRDYAVIAYKP
jgi:O-antigen chain-terminating methyltransferase